MQVQAAWGHSTGFFLRPLFDYITNPLDVSTGWDFRLLNFAAALLTLVCGSVMLSRRQWALGLYTLLCIIAPLSAMLLQSSARYALAAFPLFIVLAAAGQRPRIDQLIRTIFAALLAIMTALFAIHFSTAMS